MTTNLTLSIKKSVIEKARQYAKENNQSLSQIIESYLEQITSMVHEPGDPELDNLRGLITLPKDFELKQETSKFRK